MRMPSLLKLKRKKVATAVVCWNPIHEECRCHRTVKNIWRCTAKANIPVLIDVLIILTVILQDKWVDSVYRLNFKKNSILHPHWSCLKSKNMYLNTWKNVPSINTNIGTCTVYSLLCRMSCVHVQVHVVCNILLRESENSSVRVSIFSPAINLTDLTWTC